MTHNMIGRLRIIWPGFAIGEALKKIYTFNEHSCVPRFLIRFKNLDYRCIRGRQIRWKCGAENGCTMFSRLRKFFSILR